MLDWFKQVMTDGKTGVASTKRYAHVIATTVTAIISLIVIGIIVGLSISLPAANFQFVYSTLNSTLITIVLILTTGGAGAYVATRNNEKKE